MAYFQNKYIQKDEYVGNIGGKSDKSFKALGFQ